MSASEKLKALERKGLTYNIGYELLDALPQIVAVVEAAEAHVRSDVWIEGEPLHGPSIYAELNSGTTTSEAIVAALAALDEALV